MTIEQDTVRDLLWQLAFQFKVRCHQAVRESGLDLGGMHVRMLQVIDEEPQCTANRLCQRSGRDKAQITRLVKELERQGLVKRSPHPTDGRSQVLQLTGRAKRLVGRVREVEQDVERQYVEGLSERELAAFVATGRKMLDNVSEVD
ncbi:MarR family transcriptional regulator [Mangrovimicrobium sediminis]|uniref:MarR family transcriptional regulator n=1 Tax=Mangrovimicrobium sediminis TaxID=2562682 RepID=A0A4Z0LZH9_9GAMM|nr:MarR family transcriptional regulator [Haliea sp. SAOS-164]TGD72567.1 MarR family transcriptional regulator [Haliea sp. SAOS-164]